MGKLKAAKLKATLKESFILVLFLSSFVLDYEHLFSSLKQLTLPDLKHNAQLLLVGFHMESLKQSSLERNKKAFQILGEVSPGE